MSLKMNDAPATPSLQGIGKRRRDQSSGSESPLVYDSLEDDALLLSPTLELKFNRADRRAQLHQEKQHKRAASDMSDNKDSAQEKSTKKVRPNHRRATTTLFQPNLTSLKENTVMSIPQQKPAADSDTRRQAVMKQKESRTTGGKKTHVRATTIGEGSKLPVLKRAAFTNM